MSANPSADLWDAIERGDVPGIARQLTPPAPIEADDSALRERLRQEQQDEPRHQRREEREADDAGMDWYGPL